MTHTLNKPGSLGASLSVATLRLLAVSAIAISISGCGHRFGAHDGEHTAALTQPLRTVEERHPIEVEKARTSMSLVAPSAAHGLNTYQKERVRHFVGLWRNEGLGKMTVAGNDRAALGDLRDILIDAGVPVGAVDLKRYDGNQPGVKVSFARYIAEGPKCGAWHENLAENSNNDMYGNFGCSAQHNMAAMIANPRDLKTPRDQTDWSDGDRRDFVYRAWIQGAKTNGDATAVTKAGNVSEVAKQ
jgi:pilus assembly protein CpaD